MAAERLGIGTKAMTETTEPEEWRQLAETEPKLWFQMRANHRTLQNTAAIAQLEKM